MCICTCARAGACRTCLPRCGSARPARPPAPPSPPTLPRPLRLPRLHPSELLAEPVAIAPRCPFCLDALRYESPSELVPEGHPPASWLRQLTEEGLQQRFPAGVPPKVADLVERELGLV